MSKICVDSGSLDSAISDMGKIMNLLENECMSAIRSAISNVESSNWDDSKSENYIEILNSFEKQISSHVESLEGLKKETNDLLKIVIDYEKMM